MAFLPPVAVSPRAAAARNASETTRSAVSPRTTRMVGDVADPQRRAVLRTLSVAAASVAAGGLLRASPARADHTLVAAKRSFDRYHPRMLDAIDTMVKIKAAASANDREGAAALIDDKLFSVKAKRAFSIYATSFSDNYLGQTSKIMLKCVDRLYAQLEFVSKGEDMGEHYEEAAKAIKKYYDVARLPKTDLVSL